MKDIFMAELENRRCKARISKTDMADLLNVTRQTYCYWVNSESVPAHIVYSSSEAMALRDPDLLDAILDEMLSAGKTEKISRIEGL